MRKTPPPDVAASPAPARIAPINAAHLAAFAAHLDGRPANTRAAYLRDAHALAQLAGDADLARLDARELRRFLATLHGRGLTGRSLSRALSSWRSSLPLPARARCRRHRRSLRRVSRRRRRRRRLPSALSPDEAVRLVQIPGDDALAVRDRALFELAYSSGLRLAELAGHRCRARRSRDRRSARLGQGREGAHRSGRRRGDRGDPRLACRARRPAERGSEGAVRGPQRQADHAARRSSGGSPNGR